MLLPLQRCFGRFRDKGQALQHVKSRAAAEMNLLGDVPYLTVAISVEVVEFVIKDTEYPGQPLRWRFSSKVRELLDRLHQRFLHHILRIEACLNVVA